MPFFNFFSEAASESDRLLQHRFSMNAFTLQLQLHK